MKDVKIREFEISDWEAAWQLWQKELGKSTDDSWSREKVETFLERNPGLSFAAMVDGEFTGTVMCGFDGRRGYIYHPRRSRGQQAQRHRHSSYEDRCGKAQRRRRREDTPYGVRGK